LSRPQPPLYPVPALPVLWKLFFSPSTVFCPPARFFAPFPPLQVLSFEAPKWNTFHSGMALSPLSSFRAPTLPPNFRAPHPPPPLFPPFTPPQILIRRWFEFTPPRQENPPPRTFGPPLFRPSSVPQPRCALRAFPSRSLDRPFPPAPHSLPDVLPVSLPVSPVFFPFAKHGPFFTLEPHPGHSFLPACLPPGSL